VALFGILLINITGFGLPEAYVDPSNSGGSEGAPLYAWLATQLFFEGTQRSLFALLFGAGVILMTSRMEARGAGIEVADIYYRRNIWLVIFGMVHAYLLLWDGDILYQYGIVALFLFPLRRALPRTLFALGGGALVISFAWLLADYVEVRDLAAAADEAWEEELEEASAPLASPRLRTEQRLGPRVGKRMPALKKALADVEGAALLAELESRGSVAVAVEGETQRLVHMIQIRIRIDRRRYHVGRQALLGIALRAQEIELPAFAADQHVRAGHVGSSGQVEADERYLAGAQDVDATRAAQGVQIR